LMNKLIGWDSIEDVGSPLFKGLRVHRGIHFLEGSFHDVSGNEVTEFGEVLNDEGL
jgi:hypothetical protein